jgi:hypothetical protein
VICGSINYSFCSNFEVFQTRKPDNFRSKLYICSLFQSIEEFVSIYISFESCCDMAETESLM